MFFNPLKIGACKFVKKEKKRVSRFFNPLKIGACKFDEIETLKEKLGFSIP